VTTGLSRLSDSVSYGIPILVCRDRVKERTGCLQLNTMEITSPYDLQIFQVIHGRSQSSRLPPASDRPVGQENTKQRRFLSGFFTETTAAVSSSSRGAKARGAVIEINGEFRILHCVVDAVTQTAKPPVKNIGIQNECHT
jgi:hypothetical protein